MLATGIKTYFAASDRINESVQAAKDYLLKRAAEKLKKEKKDLTPEEQKAVLSDPDWISVRDLTQRTPGYAPIFIKFAKEQKAPLDILQSTLEAIIKNKDRLKDLPKDIAAYAEHKKTKNDQRPGYEVLVDDILVLEKKSKLKKLYNALQSKMKKAFDGATPEQINDLITISNELDGLPEKDGKEPWQTWRATLGRYENDRGYYPQFNNVNFAFETMIEEAKDFVENWKISEDEYVSNLMKIRPQLEILYSKDGILAISTRTPDAQREVQGVLSWCLKYDSHFWNYASGDRVQLVISDSNKALTDPFRMIGLTVESNGDIHAAYDVNNDSIRKAGGGSYKTMQDLLKSKGYPESLIKTLQRKIGDESRIKKALTLFYRKEESQTPIDIIKGLLNLNDGFLRGLLNQDEWEKISGEVSQIIFEIRKLKKSDFMREFKKSGIYTDAAWSIWDRLIGDDFTSQDIQEIQKKTQTNLQGMKDLITLVQKNPKDYPSITPEKLEKMKFLTQNKDEVLNKFQSKLK